jgi:Leucine-rich repeat (LRR) protein
VRPLAPKLRDGCSDLQWLNLYESNADDNAVSVVGAMRSLSELNLCGCRRVTSASALANALSLTHLCLSRTRVSSTGIIGLHTLPLLATLLLDDTLVDDIRCLQSCPALTWLNISDTRVSDVTPLAQITTLRVLTAARTLVADFTPVMRKHLTLRLD